MYFLTLCSLHCPPAPPHCLPGCDLSWRDQGRSQSVGVSCQRATKCCLSSCSGGRRMTSRKKVLLKVIILGDSGWVTSRCSSVPRNQLVKVKIHHEVQTAASCFCFFLYSLAFSDGQELRVCFCMSKNLKGYGCTPVLKSFLNEIVTKALKLFFFFFEMEALWFFNSVALFLFFIFFFQFPFQTMVFSSKIHL